VSSNGTGGGFGDAKQLLGRIGPMIAAVVIVIVLAVAGLSRVGCANLHTPPGHEGYVRTRPIAGQAEFVGVQSGPTSTGWVWRQELVNIDMRPRTYSEEMSILTRKGSELKFRAHARISLNEGQAKYIVEKLGGANWYAQNVQKAFQGAVREQVQPLEPFEVKSQRLEISRKVLAEMQRRWGDTPVKFITIDIGDIEYPETIVTEVERKFVTIQENERKDIEKRIAEERIGIGTAEARGIADAQRVIRTTLDPMFLQYEALRAIELLAESENTTFLVLPFSDDGAAPVIMNLDR
jgi:hypothetical protein